MEIKRDDDSLDQAAAGAIDKEVKHSQIWNMLKVKIMPFPDRLAMEYKQKAGAQGASNFSFWLNNYRDWLPFYEIGKNREENHEFSVGTFKYKFKYKHSSIDAK